MGEIKTKPQSASVSSFIADIGDEEKRKDSKALLKIFGDITKERPVLWSNNVIGFGTYHYKSNRSSQEGDWFLTGFSPRKNNISIYILPGFSKAYASELKNLGKHKVSSGACLYIKRLSDIDTPVLKKLIKQSLKEMKKIYGIKK